MKKVLSILLCVLLVLSLAVSFTACGEKEEEKDTDKKAVEQVEPSKEQEEIEIEEEPAVEDDAEQEVKDYIAISKDVVEENLSSDALSVTMVAKGTAVVYQYTYADMDEAPAGMKEELQATFDGAADSLDDLLDTMQTECPAVESIIYEYYESDGDLILAYEIK